MLKVVGIYRYPVKSLRGSALSWSIVDRIGLAGDRRWLVIDPDGKFQTIRQNPIMTQINADVTETGIVLRHALFGEVAVQTPRLNAETRQVTIWRDSVLATTAEPIASEFLESVMGRKVHLVYMSDPNARRVDPAFGRSGDFTSFSDGYPILLTTIESLNDLNRRLSNLVEMRRFRPNIVVEGDAPWAEDTWKVIRIDGTIFRVAKACGRCVVTTRNPDTGEQTDPQEPLKTLGQYHRAANGGIIFGQHIIPESAGQIRIGDAVEILSSGPSNVGMPVVEHRQGGAT